MSKTRHRWPASVRLLALRIAVDRSAGVAEVRDILRSEHGKDVPRTTVRAWLTTTEDPSEVPTIGSTSDRVLRLISSELKRIERQPPLKRDLERLKQCAQILRTIEALKQPSSEGKQRRTLQDLSADETATEEAVLSNRLDGLRSAA